MFEYRGNCLKVYGFVKILYLDDARLIFKYLKKELIVKGKNLRAIDLLDKSLVIKGVVENIEIKYVGDF